MAMVEAAARAGSRRTTTGDHASDRRARCEMVRDGCRRAGLEARVEPFLFAMDREMKSADLVVCRAGATTLAELTAAGRPSILIPLPTATDDHQRRNAEALVAQGAARMIEQRELTGDRLAAEIETLADDDGGPPRDEPARRGRWRGRTPRRSSSTRCWSLPGDPPCPRTAASLGVGGRRRLMLGARGACILSASAESG